MLPRLGGHPARATKPPLRMVLSPTTSAIVIAHREAQRPLRLSVRADLHTSGHDYSDIPHPLIQEAVAGALNQLLASLPMGEDAPPQPVEPAAVRVGWRPCRPGSNSGFYDLVVPCGKDMAARYSSAIQQRGSLQLDWGRDQMVPAMLCEGSDPSNPQYFVLVTENTHHPVTLDAHGVYHILADKSVPAKWVAEVSPSILEHHHGDFFAAPTSPDMATPLKKWLPHSHVPAFVALVVGGHSQVSALTTQSSIVLFATQEAGQALGAIRVRRLPMTLPPAARDPDAAQTGAWARVARGWPPTEPPPAPERPSANPAAAAGGGTAPSAAAGGCAAAASGGVPSDAAAGGTVPPAAAAGAAVPAYDGVAHMKEMLAFKGGLYACGAALSIPAAAVDPPADADDPSPPDVTMLGGFTDPVNGKRSRARPPCPTPGMVSVNSFGALADQPEDLEEAEVRKPAHGRRRMPAQLDAVREAHEQPTTSPVGRAADLNAGPE